MASTQAEVHQILGLVGCSGHRTLLGRGLEDGFPVGVLDRLANVLVELPHPGRLVHDGGHEPVDRRGVHALLAQRPADGCGGPGRVGRVGVAGLERCASEQHVLGGPVLLERPHDAGQRLGRVHARARDALHRRRVADEVAQHELRGCRHGRGEHALERARHAQAREVERHEAGQRAQQQPIVDPVELRLAVDNELLAIGAKDGSLAGFGVVALCPFDAQPD